DRPSEQQKSSSWSHAPFLICSRFAHPDSNDRYEDTYENAAPFPGGKLRVRAKPQRFPEILVNSVHRGFSKQMKSRRNWRGVDFVNFFPASLHQRLSSSYCQIAKPFAPASGPVDDHVGNIGVGSDRKNQSRIELRVEPFAAD